MAIIKSFEDIEAWKLARVMCNKIGLLIDGERFGKNFRLIDQLNGSSGSIMDNIAEGFERGTRKEFIQFLGYAKGSCGEIRSQLYRAVDRNYINQEEFEELFQMAVSISSIIQNFIKYLLKSDIEGSRKHSQP